VQIAEIIAEVDAECRLREVRMLGPEKAARLVVYLTVGEGRDVTGKLISAVWDRWDSFHRHPKVVGHKDVFTLRRILPEERNLSLD